MIDKYIISTYSHYDDDNIDMQKTEVINSQYALVNDQRYRYTHYDLKCATGPQEETSLMEAQIQPYKDSNELAYLHVVLDCYGLALFKQQRRDCQDF